ncbi:F-box/FBD/LRR-repeat protein [Quillaja saponaria]|uniref:F-box/FBD/LRR-repeat protein n=1 Tax=Quillaja saponaria TaxID=32244 RepID=A0AAD7LA95_QUISA|nr:F-box/FBD/LRR-repeat protein [Quillaja saponaria]
MTRQVERKTGDGDHTLIDRISNLPMEVIDKILVRMPIPDAIRTGILSRKWRYMWVTLSKLSFTDSLFWNHISNKHIDKASMIINQILFLHNGTISTFDLVIPSNYKGDVSLINHWILYLSKNGIKKLTIRSNKRERYEVPSHLFSCLDLKELSLRNCVLRASPEFNGFPNLTKLELARVKAERMVLESLISSCQVLDSLDLITCSGFECLCISSRCLKRITVGGNSQHSSPAYLINTEKAVFLHIWLNHKVTNFQGGEISVSNFFNSLSKIRTLILNDKYLQGPSTNYLISAEVSKCFEEEENIGDTYDHLRIMNIAKSYGLQPELEFIKYILSRSPLLEIVRFEHKIQLVIDYAQPFRIQGELLRFRRASPKAQIIFSSVY